MDPLTPDELARVRALATSSLCDADKTLRSPPSTRLGLGLAKEVADEGVRRGPVDGTGHRPEQNPAP